MSQSDPAASGQALARKWRPRSFDQMVGQEHVVRALTNALEQKRLHHAYLMTGTRGVGKTTLARVMAKALNCETGRQRFALRPVLGLHRDRRGALRRSDRAGRRLQHSGRPDARAAGERAVRADPRPLQGVHHRRSAHAVALGVQRHAQDPRGAARARQVHPGHHRSAEGPGDGAVALPAVQPEADPACSRSATSSAACSSRKGSRSSRLRSV